jgi:hypothetical protein
VLDFRNKFIILEIDLLKVLYFDPLGFLLIKICNVPCFFVPLFEKKSVSGIGTARNQVTGVNLTRTRTSPHLEI